jgi:hypothetical protein
MLEYSLLLDSLGNLYLSVQLPGVATNFAGPYLLAFILLVFWLLNLPINVILNIRASKSPLIANFKARKMTLIG